MDASSPGWTRCDRSGARGPRVPSPGLTGCAPTVEDQSTAPPTPFPPACLGQATVVSTSGADPDLHRDGRAPRSLARGPGGDRPHGGRRHQRRLGFRADDLGAFGEVRWSATTLRSATGAASASSPAWPLALSRLLRPEHRLSRGPRPGEPPAAGGPRRARSPRRPRLHAVDVGVTRSDPASSRTPTLCRESPLDEGSTDRGTGGSPGDPSAADGHPHRTLDTLNQDEPRSSRRSRRRVQKD